MVIFRQLNGILYTRKYTINKPDGHFYIMSMHMITKYVDKTCLHVRFTIFDYVTRRIIYSGIYDKFDHVVEFNAYRLLAYAKKALMVLYYERSPFAEHIATL
jgi:hypothetical protein